MKNNALRLYAFVSKYLLFTTTPRIMKIVIPAFIALTFGFCLAAAQQPSSEDAEKIKKTESGTAMAFLTRESSDPISDRLAKIGHFAFGGTGYAGIISQGEKDYEKILSRPTALKDFEQLLIVGNPQAQCYALVGIHALDSKRFDELSATFSNSKTDVMTKSGCIVMHTPLHIILKSIAAELYQLTPERKQNGKDL